MGLKVEHIGRPAGLKKKGKRVGRGIGSGKGKTSGRGHKGAGQRSGAGTYNPGFEGGQMPLVRRVPKRGFTNKFKKEWNIVNIGTLEKIASIDNGAKVDKELLIGIKCIKKSRLPLKVLGKGKLEKSITVKANAVSESARKAIEAVGGTVELVA